MHKPKLGTYPLTLRDANIKVPKRGELLYDYTDSNVESTIYYIDRETLEKINLFESSINNIKEANLENTDIIVVKDTNIIIGDEPIIPNIEHRKFNSFYYSMYDNNR